MISVQGKKMIRAVIFDLDNVLVLSNESNFLAYRQACSEFGIEMNEQKFHEKDGLSWKELIPKISGTSDMELVSKIHDKKIEIYEDFLHHDKPIVPMVSLLNLVAGNVPVAVATEASPKCAKLKIEKLGLMDKISALVTTAEVGKSKPSPDVYLKAAELLGVDPNDCLVFEDSENGVAAAKAAGMHCIKISGFYSM
jgi:HAD superfamily hydrolase (TIGR01509 family)